MAAVDMTEVENDITAYKKQQSALQRSRDSLEQDIDRIARMTSMQSAAARI